MLLHTPGTSVKMILYSVSTKENIKGLNLHSVASRQHTLFPPLSSGIEIFVIFSVYAFGHFLQQSTDYPVAVWSRNSLCLKIDSNQQDFLN